MSDLAKLLQEHSATRLLHNPTRHVCNGCGQAITSTMSEHQADVLDLAGFVKDTVVVSAYQAGLYRGMSASDAEWVGPVASLQRLHDKTGDRLRAARALVREQRETITAQDALIQAMHKTLTQQRAMAETVAALS
ncbi:hypothetical protein [Arthrobacter sp. efr-133-TYG-118]|uniref:hypothetical protein n=1 Tax=Arthrobacter sp. efr-133-TYG-118 TaxID=3040279 RepID=UPI00254B711B|nr:hypothetical protein [Arthrobacter sp. efr-133-TYG-118]